MASPGKKSYPLRIGPALWEQLQRLAANDLRSVNAEIEFLLVMPDLSSEVAEELARIQTLHRAIGDAPMAAGDGIALRVTCSFGVATAHPAAAETRASLIARADAALYAAKAAGRNRVVCATAPSPEAMPAPVTP